MKLLTKEDLSVENRVRRLLRVDPPLITHEDVLVYLELMEKLMPTYEMRPEQRLKFLRENNISQELKGKVHSQFATLVYPNWEKAIEQDIRTTVDLDIVRTALAVERFRVAQRQLPGDLKELVPRFAPVITSDAYSGKPLRFKRLDVGYVVYSVGPNGDREDAALTEGNSQDSNSIRIER